VRAFATTAIDPFPQLLLAPALAIPRALDLAGLTIDQIDVFEVHEAFAAQVLATLACLSSPDFARQRLGRDEPVGSIPADRLNPNGRCALARDALRRSLTRHTQLDRDRASVCRHGRPAHHRRHQRAAARQEALCTDLHLCGRRHGRRVHSRATRPVVVQIIQTIIRLDEFVLFRRRILDFRVVCFPRSFHYRELPPESEMNTARFCLFALCAILIAALGAGACFSNEMGVRLL
jgi:hypothetical protein